MVVPTLRRFVPAPFPTERMVNSLLLGILLLVVLDVGVTEAFGPPSPWAHPAVGLSSSSLRSSKEPSLPLSSSFEEEEQDEWDVDAENMPITVTFPDDEEDEDDIIEDFEHLLMEGVDGMDNPETSTTNSKRITRSTFNPSTKPIRRYQALKKEPLIAILGRPNVGKSALVNRIAGTQSGGAIVADEAGITRDRTYRAANFLGENFQLVDTGGLVFDDADATTLFAKEIRQQAQIAIQEASAVILVVDGKAGMTGADLQIAEYLRREVLPTGLPVHVAVNKCESETTGALSAAEFWNLGLGEPMPVSALHGVGTAELLENTFESIVAKKTAALPDFGTKVQRLAEAKLKKNSKKQLPGEDDVEYKMRKYGIGDVAKQVEKEFDDALKAFDAQDRPEEINVAIVGRPNVGKSSLLNSLFGDNRAIVSDIAGTTRDSIDAVMERPGETSEDPSTIYRFVDTAGMRRKGKVEFGPEFFMVNRALRAIRRADVGRWLVSRRGRKG